MTTRFARATIADDASEAAAVKNESRPLLSFDPRRPDFAHYGLTCVRWRPSPMSRPDHHNKVELDFLESGSVTYLFGGERIVLPAGGLGVFWGAIPHQIIGYNHETAYFVVTIPLSWFLQWRLPESFVRSLLQGQLLQEHLETRLDFERRRFECWESDLQSKNTELERVVLLDVQARLLRVAMALAVPRGQASRPTGIAPITDTALSKAERMACYIAEHYTDPLSVENIAKVVGLHPNYATSVFHKMFGISLVRFLTQHRVSHAQRILVTSECSMVDVAFDSGFNSISRFNDAFRQICGCSPREYRNSHRLVS